MILTEDEILERVDEYTLYCHYMEFEPDIGIKYSSPLRTDKSPSFALFSPKKYPNRELMWKDHATGASGDIFELVKRMYPLKCKTKDDACRIISSDFQLGSFFDKGEKIIKYTSKPKSNIDIKIVSQKFDDVDLKYFMRYYINQSILERHHVTRLLYYWMTADQQYPTYPKVRGYAYRIWDKYQLYFPTEKRDRKFRNNYDDRHLPGFLQLRYEHPLLIFTKAKKDIMMFDAFGYEAIASRGEVNPVPEEYLRFLETKYEKIIMWRDNDGKTDDNKYPYQKVYNPEECGQKDPSDFCDAYGPAETRLLIKSLTGYEGSSYYQK